MSDEWSIDGRPFPSPVNPFERLAAELRARLASMAGSIPPEAQADAEEAVQWIEHLASRCPLTTTDRVVTLALGQAATDAGLRAQLRAGVDFIEQQIAEATG